MSTPVKEFMTHMPHTIGEQTGVSKAREMMTKYSCHHLPVLQGGHLVGIVSDRDLKPVEQFSMGEDVRVQTIMTDDPVVVQPNEDIFQVAMLMHEKKIGSVIVSATPYSPWGIFTATDALKYFTEK